MAENTSSNWKDATYLAKFKLEKRGNGEIYVPTALAEKLKELGWGTGTELELAISENTRGEIYLRIYKK